MNFFPLKAPALFILSATLLFTGCDELKQRTGLKLEEQAARAIKANDFKDAIMYLEEMNVGTPATAEAHYQLGMIYSGKVNEPISALHHFRRYLALSPKGPNAKQAQKAIEELEVRVSTALSRGGTFGDNEIARLKNENHALRKQNIELRQASKPGIGTKGTNPSEVIKKDIPPGSKTYIVQPGDTLASISRKFYKTSTRWKDIQDANFYSLSGQPTIKPGQEIIIPD